MPGIAASSVSGQCRISSSSDTSGRENPFHSLGRTAEFRHTIGVFAMSSANPSPAEIVAALQRGGIVGALKLVLAAKGVGSSGEKKGIAAQVDGSSKLLRVLPLSSKATDLSPGEVPRSSNDIWLLLLVAAVLCIAYYFFAS